MNERCIRWIYFLIFVFTVCRISGMLWRDSTTWRWQGTHGKYTKDLSKINRDLNRVVILETDPNVALQKENQILLTPFTDGNEEDNELLELVPFLENLCMRNVGDLRDELAKYKGEKSIAKAYNAKMAEEQAAEKAEMDKGIGGTLRLLRGADNKSAKKPGESIMPWCTRYYILSCPLLGFHSLVTL